ncbi:MULTISPECIES: hypothetical protein [Ectopseudomonas]|jgi:hypothetical protein|uniref:Uncharacterized protein n=2 Tax=Ectopseudomonas TaxID=3236654 RepID=A0A1G6Q5T5_9GAMM|nr:MULTISPECIES: hypothetical protein [Pseudomonas]ALN21760.1 hypothetical protein DW68_024080 [Pseudomonas mendocina S5.2]KER98181.1 hypothetical protein HN51_25645 [Pseudomonas mendocina]MBP3062067.1 hypothetical protein [Pseudomonas chengduensis]NNB75359.1 hypothetical protein [Pseudomonas chengduensis]OEO24393.1 hypothetical protein AX279_17140 [Pseudomonas sp. J237]
MSSAGFSGNAAGIERVAYRLPEELGGDEVKTLVPEAYLGAVAMRFCRGAGQRCAIFSRSLVAVFPSIEEATMAAIFAIWPDKGGFSDVYLVPAPDAQVSHRRWYDWASAPEHVPQPSLEALRNG